MKLKVSDYARLEGITTAGVYKRHKDGKITIEHPYGGSKLVVLTDDDYEVKKLAYKESQGHKFKLELKRKKRRSKKQTSI